MRPATPSARCAKPPGPAPWRPAPDRRRRAADLGTDPPSRAFHDACAATPPAAAADGGAPVSQLTLPDVSKKMRDIDFMMLMTKTEGGEIAGRPMSNNRDVEY